jgi:prepilin-type N-terminal cleavage/methylation domain-containing protein
MAADNITKKMNIKLLPVYSKNVKSKLGVLASGKNQENSGFTALEMIVVALMVGILAAIAAPGWLGFVNRQRVNQANDAVLSALQQAQRQAVRTKVEHSVTFRNNNDIPEVAIHQGAIPNTPADWNKLNWQNLIDGGDTQGKNILLGTNLNNPNSKQANVAFGTNLNPQAPQTIRFDSMGILAPKTNNTAPDTELKIVVAVPNSTNPPTPTNTKRCVMVTTLLGTMKTAKDDDCN